MNKGENGFKRILSIIGVVAIIIFFFSINPFVQIGAGERGVVMNWGQVQDRILSEGLHLRIPVMQSVQKVSVRVQKSDVKTSGASKDLQDVGLELVVNWKINTAKVNKVYQTIGDERAVLDNIIIPAVSEMAKAASAKKTAEEIITKRQELLDSWDLCDICEPIVESGFSDIKDPNQKEKGIDVWIAIDMVKETIKENIDIAVLISGDADFVPAFSLIKEIGKEVLSCYVPQGYSNELRQKFPFLVLNKETLTKCLKDYKKFEKSPKGYKGV